MPPAFSFRPVSHPDSRCVTCKQQAVLLVTISTWLGYVAADLYVCLDCWRDTVHRSDEAIADALAAIAKDRQSCSPDSV